MNIVEYKLQITTQVAGEDDDHTYELVYRGNENIIIRSNYFTLGEKANTSIVIPRHILEKFVEIISNE